MLQLDRREDTTPSFRKANLEKPIKGIELKRQSQKSVYKRKNSGKRDPFVRELEKLEKLQDARLK